MKRLLELTFRWLDRDLFSTTFERQLMQQVDELGRDNERLSKQLVRLKKKENSFVVTKILRGARHDYIEIPTIDEYKKWIYEELIPTLSKNGRLVNRMDNDIYN